jgi:YVTN family beta-propeller protein
VGKEPEGVLVTPDGQKVYVTNETSGTVTVLDARTGRQRTEFRVGARPRFVAFSPDAAYALVTSESGGSVTIVDLPKDVPLKTVAVGDSTKPTGVAIAPDNKTAYFANGRANRVSIFSIAAMTVTDSIPVGQRPWGVALSTDGSTLYTADGRSNQISVVDVIHKKVLRTVSVGERPYGVVIVGG